MSVNVIYQPHPLRSSRINITTSPKTVSEILDELNSGFPQSQARVCRNGEIVKDFSARVNDGDTLWIKFVPYGSTQDAGAGMKVGGWMLAVIGIAIGAATFWTGAGAFFAATLIGTGLSMALGGTVLLNIDVPKMDEKPKQDPSIRGGRNQMRQHGRIPVLFGRHRIYPDLAANPHTEILGNQQFFVQLFCGGYKDYEIDLKSIKLGDTPIIDLSQTKNIQQILCGADPVIQLEILQNGEASNIYPFCVHEDALNSLIQKEMEDGEGNKAAGDIIRTTPDNTDRINIDILLPGGLGKYNDKNKLTSASVEIRAWYKPAGADDNAYQSLGFFNDNSNVISGESLNTKRYQITKSNLARGKYTIKLERVTPDSSGSKVIDQVYAGSIRSFKTKRPIRAERQKHLTIIALRVMATARIAGVLDSFNYTAASKLSVYSGNGSGPLSWSQSVVTRNPASMLLYALRGRAAQQTVDPDDIDWLSLEKFYAWCEDHAYTCNAYLADSVTMAELMRMIGSTSRADILRIDSKISVVQDIERPAHIMLFTPKNSINYSVTMFKADIPDAIHLRYIDEAAGFAQSELPVYNTPDGNQVKEPESVQKVDLWGVTDDKQARRIGMYNYACLKNRPFVHTIEVDIEYLIGNKGDWIQYAGDIALTGSAQGRIKEALWSGSVCTGVRLDEPIVTEPGKQYALRIRLKDGSIILENVSNVDEHNNIAYFEDPIAANQLKPQKEDLYAFGVRGAEVIDLVIVDILPGANFTATLTCVEYSREIFGVDDPDFILPEFENKITPVSGAVDSGIVSPENWQQFAAYHDDEEEPQRPTGDGQNGGWYRMQNTQSVWVSMKRALSVEAGVWGPPIKIKAEDGKYADHRFAKNTSVNTAPEFAGQDTDNPGDNWLDTPPVIDESEFLWMITSDWRNGQRLTLWSLPTRISGPVGSTGQNAVYLDLDNENHSIACFQDGTPKPCALGFNVTATLYDGMSAVPGDHPELNWLIHTDAAGITHNNLGVVTVSNNAVLGDVTLVTVIALYKGTSYFSVLTLSKVKDGSHGMDGADAVTFDLRPSVSVVRRDNQGVLTPSAVSCLQFKHTAGQITPSTEILKYQLSTMSASANYTGAVNIGSALWVEFTLLSGSGMILDRERVPVVMDGDDGSYFEPRYTRADAQPATPTGNTPVGWVTAPPEGTGRLWMIRGQKDAGGNLIGAWSAPVQINGENGLGIDNLPRDAWAYYSCDELPEVPDNPTGTKYKNDPAWEEWGASGSGGSLSVENGIARITNISPFGGYIFMLQKSWSTGDFIFVRVRQPVGVLTSLRANPNSPADGTRYNFGILAREWQWRSVQITTPDVINGRLSIYANNYTSAESVIELSHFYIGNASYISPLLDNSGNSRHMIIPKGVFPIQGIHGNGLNFLGTGGAYISNPQELFSPEGDFTFTLWINKFATGAAQYVVSNVESSGGISIIINADGRIGVTYYRLGSGGSLYVTLDNAPDNKWLFLIIKYDSGVRRFYVKIDNRVVNTGSILPGPIDWSTVARGVPLALGANPGQFTTSGTSSLSGFFSGQLDEVAVFTRFTTDAEDTAMHKTSLPKFFNPSISREPRYLGKTADIGGSNGVAAIQVTSTLTQSVQAFPGDWVAYIGGTSGAWVNGMCMRWTGTAWLQIPVELDGNFESNPYMLAMFDLTNNAPSAAFMTLMVQNLVAKTAMIEKIFTSLLKVNNNGAVFGGPRFEVNAQGQLIDNGANLAGFKLGADGKLLASNVDISGHMKTTTGEFLGSLIIGDAWDINGAMVNQNARGSLLAKSARGINEFEELRTSNLNAYNKTYLGRQFGNIEGETIIYGALHIRTSKGTSLNENMYITGNYTAANFDNLLDSKFKKGYFTVNGSLLIERNVQGGTESYLFFITCIEVDSYMKIIHGFDDRRRRCLGGLYPTRFVFQTYTGTNITTITGSSTIEANFVIL